MIFDKETVIILLAIYRESKDSILLMEGGCSGLIEARNVKNKAQKQGGLNERLALRDLIPFVSEPRALDL